MLFSGWPLTFSADINTFKHFLDKQNSFIHQHADALYVLQLI